MKLTDNFYLREFIDPDTYKMYGNASIWFLDRKIIEIAQKLRERLNVVLYINTWFITGGSFSLSGFRPPDSQVGATLSQHKFGRAIDIKTHDDKFNGASMLRKEIKDNYTSIYKALGVTTIEHQDYAPSWCHLDTRYTGEDKLLIIKP